MTDETCLCIDLRHAAQRLTAIYDKSMAPSGLTVNQFSQLHLIQTLGNPTVKALAAASGLDRSTLGRNIRVLEKLGFVAMKVGDDARTRCIHTTRKGSAAFRKAVPLWRAMQDDLTSKIGPERRHELRETLQTLTAPAAASELTDNRTTS